MDALLKLVAEKPSLKLMNKTKLKQKIREITDDIPNSIIDKYYDERELNQIYKRPAPVKEKQLKITAPKNSFQIDIVILPGYKKYNNNIDKFLLLVDIPSRKAWAYTLKNGTMDEVLDKYENFIIELGEEPNSVAGDAFFDNEEFLQFNRELFIDVYTDVAKDDHITRRTDKLGILDRCVRTLKQMIQKYMLENEDLKWTKFIDDIIDSYNDTPNVGIKNNTPDEVYDDDLYIEKSHEAAVKKNAETFKSYGFSIGDTVRILVNREQFEKEKARFSTDLYTIAKQEGYRYRLIDEDGEYVKRLYKPNELQKVNGVSNRLNTRKITQAKQTHKKTKNITKEKLDIPYDTATRMVTQAEYARPRETRSQATKTRSGTTRRRDVLY